MVPARRGPPPARGSRPSSFALRARQSEPPLWTAASASRPAGSGRAGDWWRVGFTAARKLRGRRAVQQVHFPSPSMSTSLNGAAVAILATDGFEQSELMKPMQALQDAGATVHVVSPESGQIKGWDQDDWGKSVDVDKTLSDASAGDYAALVLPGGQINPDKLRVNDDALSFVKSFAQAGKPVAAICHAPWLVIEAGLAEGRHMTSYKSIRTDLKNAGAKVQDSEVVVCPHGDFKLITSRNPDDLPAFNDAVISAVAETMQAA